MKTTDGLKPRQRAFLAAYATCGNRTAAARIAKVARTQHYVWMDDPAYSQAFEFAHEEACDLLEGEAWRRGYEGIDEPIVFQGEITHKVDVLGRRTRYPQTIKKYSDMLLMALLNANLPEKFRQNWKGELRHSGNVGRGVDLSNLTDDQLSQLRAISEAAIGK